MGTYAAHRRSTSAAPQTRTWRLLMALPVIVASGFCQAPAAGEVVRISNGEWPPFTSADLPHGGILSRIVTQSFALEGITVHYAYLPWRRAYQEAKQGKWDGSVGWAPTPEHRRDFHMSAPVLQVDKALFHLDSVPFDWKTIDDLRRWRLGAAAGYSYGVDWDRAARSGQLYIEEVATDEANLRKLLHGRVDAVAMEVEVAEYLMHTRLTAEEAVQIRQHPRLLSRMPICLALSRALGERGPQLVARFNHGLHRLKESGSYDAYLAESRDSPTGTPSGERPGKRDNDAQR